MAKTQPQSAEKKSSKSVDGIDPKNPTGKLPSSTSTNSNDGKMDSTKVKNKVIITHNSPEQDKIDSIKLLKMKGKK